MWGEKQPLGAPPFTSRTCAQMTQKRARARVRAPPPPRAKKGAPQHHITIPERRRRVNIIALDTMRSGIENDVGQSAQQAEEGAPMLEDCDKKRPLCTEEAECTKRQKTSSAAPALPCEGGSGGAVSRSLDYDCLSVRNCWTPHLAYMAPELKRGKCGGYKEGGCKQEVTWYHLRYVDADKCYYHADENCLPDDVYSKIGECKFCGEDIVWPLAHTKKKGGMYHGLPNDVRSCWQRMLSEQKTGLEEETMEDTKKEMV